MPAWIHDRAQHLLAKNPDMDKSKAFAIATQQGHSLGKTPKKYGTKSGRQEAKAKYDKPKKEYVKTPNPGKLETPKLAQAGTAVETEKAAHDVMMRAFHEELFLIKNAGIMDAFKKHVLGKAPTALASGPLQAQGIQRQMAKGRNYGGAAVDPFVKKKMR